jgi:hypothetical protein
MKTGPQRLAIPTGEKKEFRTPKKSAVSQRKAKYFVHSTNYLNVSVTVSLYYPIKAMGYPLKMK